MLTEHLLLSQALYYGQQLRWWGKCFAGLVLD